MVHRPTGIVMVASLQATLMHVNLQVRVNKTLMDSLLSKVNQLQVQHGGDSFVKSGATPHLLEKYTAFLYFCTLETDTFLPD